MENDTRKLERLVVFDCDIGTDDAWALALLLRGEQLSLASGRRYKLIAITCVQGNTDVVNGAQKRTSKRGHTKYSNMFLLHS